ncbi:hypothetical protein EYC80_010099 [Monilinia laxa]|uniref:Uncharacterized protein n=1 Tax=Monilinia laxa TaxID=61186 RepID=A0A5N6JRM1_MONLA|nr:hypothetical protein EYC80_010099 [Monilinia laxa]
MEILIPDTSVGNPPQHWAVISFTLFRLATLDFLLQYNTTRPNIYIYLMLYLLSMCTTGLLKYQILISS